MNRKQFVTLCQAHAIVQVLIARNGADDAWQIEVDKTADGRLPEGMAPHIETTRGAKRREWVSLDNAHDWLNKAGFRGDAVILMYSAEDRGGNP